MNTKKILFATTNTNKVQRIKNLISDTGINLLTLKDLDFEIEEPIETGKSVVEIAKNTAIYYYKKIDGLYGVLAQDDGMDFFGNVESNEDPGSCIKASVVDRYGVFNIENAIKYYSNLAKKYGGEIDFAFRYGHAYIDKMGVKTDSSILFAKLVDTPYKIEQVGKYPLRALTKIKIGDNYKYSADMTLQEGIYSDNDLKRALKQVLRGV